MSRTPETCLRLLAITAATLLFVLLLGSPVLAQAGRPPASAANDPTDPINQDKANKTDMRNREFMMGNNGKPIRRAAWGPTAAVLPQIKDDFERLQIVNKELMTAIFANNVINPKQIAKATSDIEKRASRMINNLSYPQAEDSEKTPSGVHEGNDIRLALAKLDSAIMDFVNNPIFKTNPQVVNAELARQVNKELRTVVKLSQLIRRQAETLAKTQKAS